MAKIRKFRWPSGDGFDVVGDDVYYFENGERASLTLDWTVPELEGYASISSDPLNEVIAKVRAEVHNTRVLLVDGDVMDIEDAKELCDQLQQAIAEFEGENTAPVTQKIDRNQRTSREEPDFPGQILVKGTWTSPDEGDGWVRTSFATEKHQDPDKRLHLKFKKDTLHSIVNRYDRSFGW